MGKSQNRMKELRRRNLLSQKDLAEALHVSQATISGWETGAYEPDQSALIDMAKLFNVTIDYIMGISDEENSTVHTPPEKTERVTTPLSDIEFALAGEIHGLTDNEKLDVLDYVRFKKAKKNDAK